MNDMRIIETLLDNVDAFVDDMDMANENSHCSWAYHEGSFDTSVKGYKGDLYDVCESCIVKRYDEIYAIIGFVDELGILPFDVRQRCYGVAYYCYMDALFEIDALAA